ncbi:glycoside hydrolase family 43 protein [Gelidibacter salicanalis]|uniref:Family 43 glycosylhydrolase n=1 Tax=Gelidibacter salicanalis TaxID=291193 RepID=A0A934KW94_9FLAO|nr:glycoside hydrolase family 43 protein [Gelidibacter salicanalis]MBJ7880525.1 family 43 glycosylhydrolase [Gelidibacter salicanalis]
MQIRQTLIALLFFTSILSSFSQNPVISQRYTADPTGLEYDGRLYLWTSHDIDEQKRYWMNDITCVSTDDMQNWTDHGEVFKAPEDMPWVTQAWAPSVVERNGKFYLYTGDGNRSVNVSVSDSPTGPFKGVGNQPLITKETPNADVEWLFDPTVFIDDDGQAYCVFGGGPTKILANGKRRKNARIIKLGDDLVSTVGEAVLIDAPGFYEGGYISQRKVNGKTTYYFSYFTNIGTGMNIDYMMSDDPMSGWEYKGTVLKQPADNYNNSHASVFSFKDKWYLGYHTRKIATDRKVDEKIALRQRSVCVDELFFNADGTIKEVVPTLDGPKQMKTIDPFQKNEAETMAAQSYLLPGIETATCDDEKGGRMVTNIENGDWIKVSGVDFKEGAKMFEARISAQNFAAIEIRLGSETGQLIGKCDIVSTGGLNYWETVSCSVKDTKGIHDIFFRFSGQGDNMLNFNWWKFKEGVK